MEKKKKEKVANKKTAHPFLYPSVYTEDKPNLSSKQPLLFLEFSCLSYFI